MSKIFLLIFDVLNVTPKFPRAICKALVSV